MARHGRNRPRQTLERASFAFFFLLVAVDAAIVSKPQSGECLCATTAVNGRSSGSLSGTRLVVLNRGSCGTFAGGTTSQNGYRWYQMTYSGKTIWVAGNYLNASPSSSCGGHDQLPSTCPKIISRSEWGARYATPTYLSSQPVTYAFIHHSDTPECFDQSTCKARVYSFQRYHMVTKGWSDIGYSFIIGGDGSVYKGRGWDRVGAHTRGYNSVGLGFCLIGNFTTKTPPQVQMNAAKQLLACGVKLGKLKSNYILRGHRDMVSTSCPGDKLYSIIKTWTHYTS